MSSHLALRIKKHIDKYYESNLTLSSLSRICGISRYQVFRLFRDFYGVTPYQYLLDVRLRRATAMLLDNEPIAEIAPAVGFVDQSHMTRHFRRHLALTPHQIVVSPDARAAASGWLGGEAGRAGGGAPGLVWCADLAAARNVESTGLRAAS